MAKMIPPPVEYESPQTYAEAQAERDRRRAYQKEEYKRCMRTCYPGYEVVTNLKYGSKESVK